jgi:carboxypeptidase Q
MNPIKSIFIFIFLYPFSLISQNDSIQIRKIHDLALTNSSCYSWLEHLCLQIGGRLSGSTNAQKAVDYTAKELKNLGIDVIKQPCKVPHWERGKKEVVNMIVGNRKTLLHACALGNSIGTNGKELKAEIIEVGSLDALKNIDASLVKGKIVFFNGAMNPIYIETFRAYGESVGQRYIGPAFAQKKGAVGVLVRSMTTEHDIYPHTGAMKYDTAYPTIPAIAISTLDADLMSKNLKSGKVTCSIQSDSKMLTPVDSYNVIAEIKGSTFPEEIIAVGGHLDSWDTGQGAHDDGAGCVHSMSVMELIKQSGYKPKRTIRCVLFMNEENGTMGAKAYAEASNKNKEKHIAAIESDEGGFTPRGFSIDAKDEVIEKHIATIKKWEKILAPYYLTIDRGGSGADIDALKNQGGAMIGFKPDPQRYFTLHHTAEDTFDKINKRELELGAAAITSLVYLLDNYGL